MIPITVIEIETPPIITCATCQACCCQLEVLLITETGVPDHFIQHQDDSVSTMLRLDDGWCAALDRTSMRCTIYELRPLICREFEMSSDECIDERDAYGL